MFAAAFVFLFNVIAAVELVRQGDYSSLMELIMVACAQQWVRYLYLVTFQIFLKRKFQHTNRIIQVLFRTEQTDSNDTN